MLANALANNQNAIAACGLVLVELEPGYEWSVWNLYQQFQYTFGQYVRRRAEHYIGKVTCLPGCITMISVREEMGGAIQKELIGDSPIQCSRRANIYARYLYRTLSVRQ
ncbi:hypothetical protein SNK03_13652 [Fusarium graminearum]|uniref:hypothetical protein n=1 Tax=Gibberella zeae (strain ATCC MYA-4620 / CBS 123657 / FGSC 9075 / NRRL 31084 / PH-1) TaxID=229533 RepID=UPI00021F19D9|nr:hypothetical protein FGSG_11491 [Fusarium graminearum PH-1]ESU18099.1 hypothetical protein FGSG_11491 [Fusarium graminearum PH-1]|eukprot:XP_011325721.1 hypothetical protein FGSG_11491 [Fusarium graminearum PH-1]